MSETYEEVMAQALKIRDKAIAQALKVYDETTAQALKAYEEAELPQSKETTNNV